MESISLYELNEYIQRVVALNFEESLWVHFELSNVKESRGHWYFDCLEKDGEKIIARSSGAIWAREYAFIKKKLKGLLSEILQDGVVIAAKVSVDYHTVYGFKLVIKDIDPAYTFGALALEKEKTWKRIQEEGLDAQNSELDPPSVIQRIAILSNEGAAGYKDFVAQLETNAFGYQFDLTLFESAVQGNQVKKDFESQTDIINEEYDDFDLVVVIRGGGSRLDLQAFDDYSVVRSLATCKVPVWVGVGHEIDESLCDLVASSSFKTPTAVAAAIIHWNERFEQSLLYTQERIADIARQRIKSEDNRLDHIMYELRNSATRWIRHRQNSLTFHHTSIQDLMPERIRLEKYKLKRTEEVLSLLDPQSILNRGFAVIEKDGKRIRKSTELKTGESVTIQMKDDSIQATIDKL